MPRSHHARWLIAGALLVAAACSDDDDDGADDTAPETTTAGEATTTDATTPSTEGGEAPPEEPIGPAALTLGFIGPGVGLLDELVVGQDRGITLAIEDINAAGGVLGGPVALVRADEGPDTTVDGLVDDLVGQGANALLGPVGSQTATSLVPIVATRGITTCSASATAESVTDSTDGRTFFRTALRDDHLASYVADSIVASRAPGRVMIASRNDIYGAELLGALSAELSARGVEVTTQDYPPRRVAFADEAAAVAATNPDVLLVAAYEEAPNLLADVARAGFPMDRVIGLDGLLVPRLPEQTFPSDPAAADGLTVIATTGDRALTERLREVSAPQDQISYGGQMYDCVVTIALAAAAAASTDSAAIGAQVAGVTSGGRACSTYAHCVSLLAAGEDIDYSGTTGRILIDERGDISTARITTLQVIEGALVSTGAVDVDLATERQVAIFASSVLVTQLQLALRTLGYYDGEITGVYDEATTAAVAAFQTAVGLPATGQFDEATDAALRQILGDGYAAMNTSIMQLQQALTDLGFYTGPIDGRYSAATIEAVRAAQRALGVPETGIIDVATLRAMYARGQASVPTTIPPQTTLPPPPPDTTAPPPPPPPDPTTTTTDPPVDTTTPTTDAPAEPTLREVLERDFPAFAALLLRFGIFADPDVGLYTVFAPTDAALAASGVDGMTDEEIELVLYAHLVENQIDSSELPAEVNTLAGPIQVGRDGGTITLTPTVTGDPAEITQPDIAASDGIVHGIDGVLLAP